MGKKEWGIDDPSETYWFNTRTNEVEEGPQSLAIYRIGPFDTRAEAERALDVVAERAKAWNDEDAEEER
ncbi:MAG: methionine aminopeptidase [Leucobacter sp.]